MNLQKLPAPNQHAALRLSAPTLLLRGHSGVMFHVEHPEGSTTAGPVACSKKVVGWGGSSNPWATQRIIDFQTRFKWFAVNQLLHMFHVEHRSSLRS